MDLINKDLQIQKDQQGIEEPAEKPPEDKPVVITKTYDEVIKDLHDTCERLLEEKWEAIRRANLAEMKLSFINKILRGEIQ